MPCSACGSSKGKGGGRGHVSGMNLGVRGCGSYWYFRRRRTAGR